MKCVNLKNIIKAREITKMSKHNSKVLKVYEQCETVLKLKRTFLQQIYIPSLPNVQTSPEISGVKDFSTVHYIQMAVANFFKQVRQNYTEYKEQVSTKKAIEGQISTSIQKIKNTKDLTSKHQQLEHELEEMKKQWEKQDPLVYYEVSERSKFKHDFNQRFNEFKESQSGIKNIKNPHFVHQLINQLKENLQKISEEDKQYDDESEQKSLKISRYLKDLTKEMELNIESIKFRSFLFEQKKKLFSQFLDVTESSGSKNFRSSRHSNLVRHYFEELILVSKDIKQHFKKLILLVDQLITYFQQVNKILAQEQRSLEKKFQALIEQIIKNKQIRVILRIDVQERINNNLKAIFGVSEMIRELPLILENYKHFLIQCYNEASNYHERYITRQLKFKQNTDSFEKMLIEHKGYFASLQKKQQKYNQMNIENLRKIVRHLYQTMKTIYQDNIKSSKLRPNVPVHETINKIFAQYNFDEEKSELNDTKSTINNVDLNMQAKIKEYEKFIESVQIFDYSGVNWSNQYFACSLGPKLLIHGYMQMLQQGIFYESSFNKKNYFFGKTRLFIPKSEIYEINKQKVLILFPDVIEIKVNKGEVYFHALGKRQEMYDQLINTYFPEVPETENMLNRELEYEFNDFKGENTQDKCAYKMKPYSVDFGESTLKNGDLRVIFRRYLSDDSFMYQGKQYRNFKCYQLEHVGGLNASSNELTPAPPYYFMKKGEPVESETVPEFSIRMSTFEKKIPVIPFISKGGNALCEEKSTYYWGGPDFLVVDIQNIMKGFKLTEGMMIRIRVFYRQDKDSNQVHISASGEITFQSEGALSGTIKSEALAETKIVMSKTFEAMKKNEKNRCIYKNQGNNIQQTSEENYEFKDEIDKLKQENLNLKNRFKIFILGFLILYLFTLLYFKTDPNLHDQGTQTNEIELKSSGSGEGFWSFL